MRPKKKTLGSVSNVIVPVSQYDEGYRVQVGGTFAATYSVEHTSVDIHKLGAAAALWTSDSPQAAATTPTSAHYEGGITAFRFNVTAYTSGELEFHLTSEPK